MYLHITKDCNFFIFGDRLRHVFKPLFLYFDLCNADTPSSGYMQQPYCTSLGSRFCKFETTTYNMIYRFFLLVTYPAWWIDVIICKVRLSGLQLSDPLSQLSVYYNYYWYVFLLLQFVLSRAPRSDQFPWEWLGGNNYLICRQHF